MAPLLAPADFRSVSVSEACTTCELTDDEASDIRLTAAIARLTQRLNEYCEDEFVAESLTLELDGSGTSRLMLPKRCTAVATVKTRNEAGTLAAQASTLWRLHSSLYATGSKSLLTWDWLDIIPAGGGLASVTNPYAWPVGPQTVQVVGTFGWTTPPGDAKRALALMVYDHMKPTRADLRRAVRRTTAEEAIEYAGSDPTGIPEVDEIIARLRRPPTPIEA